MKFLIDNNFGEIEMCLNEKLEYDVKIKSRSCELFVLKKNDFLRLSVNFKEFIENFLYKSLMKFLKFSDIRKKMVKEEENKLFKLNLESKKEMVEENNILEQVNEEKDDQSEIFYSEGSSEDKSDTEKEGKNQIEPELKQIDDFNKKLNTEMKKNKTEERKSLKFKSKDEEENSFPVYNNTMKIPNKDKTENDKTANSDFEKSKENIACNSDDSVDKYKNNINKKFIKKIDKILEYLEENGIEFSNDENNPKTLLRKLKTETNIVEKNNIMDKIENYLNEFYKDNL
jgi:hypothetical protein